MTELKNNIDRLEKESYRVISREVIISCKVNVMLGMRRLTGVIPEIFRKTKRW